MSYSLRPRGLQHARSPCPSLSPGVCPSSCPLNRWCYPTSPSLCPFNKPKFMSTVSLILSNHSTLCPALLHLPSKFPSTSVFFNELTLWIRWPKYWNFGFSISISNEYSGLISFRMDWSDLLVVQGTLKSFLQHHSPKASVLQHSAFFILQLTSVHDYWRNHSLDKTDLCWQSNVSAFEYAI